MKRLILKSALAMSMVAVALCSAHLALAQAVAVSVVREAPLMAEDPQLEARLVDLSQELRCLVCQNESLASSHAELADDLRQEVRGLIRSGKSDQEIKDFLVARYGDFVLYRPEIKPLTWVLWFGPFLLLLVAAIFLAVYLHQRRALSAPAVLSGAARERAKQLLKG
ncbi:cytochrome c-type biogenesis protein [Limnohabitans sp.]|uniref:cytochrome c-type biogenesis protein n=1 Tax=Limnohabitans sp. TaxID=1907725 RepID=UPI00286FA567|nr:cytochrome c-type biogenesis protein [Limnohabitans sp.]